MMARGPCTFKQRDAARLMKAAKDAGFDEVRLEVELGNGCKMVVVAGKAATMPSDSKEIVL